MLDVPLAFGSRMEGRYGATPLPPLWGAIPLEDAILPPKLRRMPHGRKETGYNKDCKEGAHKEHLCFLMYEGFHFSNKDAYKALVKDAEYRCQNCGRTAKSAANLCAPVKL